MKRIVKKKYNIEKGFISKLVETKDMKQLKELQINSTFLTGDNKRIFIYIQKVFKDTGEVPTARALEQKFPSYELETYNADGQESIGTEESLAYWCTELRTKAKHNRMAEMLEVVADNLENGKTNIAYEELKKGVWQIEDQIEEKTSVDITKNTDDRKAKYLERKKNKGMMGIPTGIPHLDYILKGLIAETLTTVIATTGVGKTWLLVLMGAYAQLNGYKVVVFVTEMGTELMQDRFEAMLFGMMYGNFSYNNFKSGALDQETEQQYFEFLEEDLPKLEPLIVESVAGVSSVSAVLEREKPDLVMIDGAYLMEDDQGAKDDWAKITHITRDLKKLAKARKLPFVINTQADQNTSKKVGPGLGDIKYSQAIAQDSDNILSLFRDEIMFNDKEMGIKVLKQREGMTGKVVVNWDFDTMNFKSIYSEAEGSNDSMDDSDDNTQDTESNILGID